MVYRWWDDKHAGALSSNAAVEAPSVSSRPTRSRDSASTRFDLSDASSKAVDVSSTPETTQQSADALTPSSNALQGQSLGSSRPGAHARFRQVTANTGINQGMLTSSLCLLA